MFLGISCSPPGRDRSAWGSSQRWSARGSPRKQREAWGQGLAEDPTLHHYSRFFKYCYRENPEDPLKRGWLTCSLAVLAHGQDWSFLRRKWSFGLFTETDITETSHVLTDRPDRPGQYRQKSEKCWYPRDFIFGMLLKLLFSTSFPHFRLLGPLFLENLHFICG